MFNVTRDHNVFGLQRLLTTELVLLFDPACSLRPSKGNIDADTKDARAREPIGQHLIPNIRTNIRQKNIPNLTRFSSYFFLGTRYHKVPTFRLPTPVLMRPSSKEWRRCSSWTFLTPRYIRPSATWMSYILGFWNGRPRQPLAHPGMLRIITGPAPVEVTRSEENGRNKIIILPPDVSPLWRPTRPPCLTNFLSNDRSFSKTPRPVGLEAACCAPLGPAESLKSWSGRIPTVPLYFDGPDYWPAVTTERFIF